MSGIGEKIANKYARALFESFEESQLEGVEAALRNLAEVWQSDENVRAALLSPMVLASERSEALLAVGKMVAEAAGVSPVEHLSRFLSVVESNGRIHGLPEIASCFSELLRELKKELRVTVISAAELEGDEKKSIEEKVKRDASSLSQIDWQIDESILGGVIIRTGDKEIDGSVRGALSGARASLMAS